MHAFVIYATPEPVPMRWRYHMPPHRHYYRRMPHTTLSLVIAVITFSIFAYHIHIVTRGNYCIVITGRDITINAIVYYYHYCLPHQPSAFVVWLPGTHNWDIPRRRIPSSAFLPSSASPLSTPEIRHVIIYAAAIRHIRHFIHHLMALAGYATGFCQLTQAFTPWLLTIFATSRFGFTTAFTITIRRLFTSWGWRCHQKASALLLHSLLPLASISLARHEEIKKGARHHYQRRVTYTPRQHVGVIIGLVVTGYIVTLLATCIRHMPPSYHCYTHATLLASSRPSLIYLLLISTAIRLSLLMFVIMVNAVITGIYIVTKRFFIYGQTIPPPPCQYYY